MKLLAAAVLLATLAGCGDPTPLQMHQTEPPEQHQVNTHG